MGQLDPSAAGSLSRLNPARICSGDGTVLSPRYKASPGDRQLNRETGELEQVRHDPDATWYKTGDNKVVRGHSFVLIESRSEHEDEIVLLGVRYQRKDEEGGEGGLAIRMIKELRPLLPGLQGVTWDKALRGKHIDELYTLELQAVVKVSRAKSGAVKSQRIGRQTVNGATTQTVELYARAGAIGIYVIAGGKEHWIKARQRKRYLRRDATGVRWYATYQLPNAAPVPASLRDATFDVRLNGRLDTDPAGLNRAEVIRPVTESDDEWKDLYGRRPGSESTNSWFKARLPGRRAPALGAKRNAFEMLMLQLFANIRARLAFHKRTSSA